MEAIEQAAFTSVGRASGFAGLAILCIMLALSFEPLTATRVGFLLGMFLALALAIYARCAFGRPYQRTEVWLILKKEHRPPATTAQRMIGQALHEASLWFADRAAAASVALWVISLVYQVVESVGASAS